MASATSAAAPGWPSISACRSRPRSTCPGVDLILPDISYLVEERKNISRAGAHPRARGPFRRAARPVAAAEGADLCHAVHGGPARGEMRGRAGCAENPRHRRRAGQPFRRRAVRHRAGNDGAFDSGIERADHPHAGRHRAAHRRLEDRSDADPARSDRREKAARAGRGGLSGAGRRFHQCRARRPLAVGSRRCENDCRARQGRRAAAWR